MISDVTKHMTGHGDSGWADCDSQVSLGSGITGGAGAGSISGPNASKARAE